MLHKQRFCQNSATFPHSKKSACLAALVHPSFKFYFKKLPNHRSRTFSQIDKGNASHEYVKHSMWPVKLWWEFKTWIAAQWDERGTFCCTAVSCSGGSFIIGSEDSPEQTEGFMMHDANRGLHRRGGEKIHATESNLRSELTDGVFQIPHLCAKRLIFWAHKCEKVKMQCVTHTLKAVQKSSVKWRTLHTINRLHVGIALEAA